MQVANVFYFLEKLTNLNFDVFCKKTLCNGKTAITFAYDLRRKSVTYLNDRHEILYANSTAFSRVAFFRIYKFEKSKKL